MTDAEILMIGLAAGASLIVIGGGLGAIAMMRFGERNGNIKPNTYRSKEDEVPSSDNITTDPAPAKRRTMPDWRAKWKKDREESLINLSPVVEAVEEDSILIDLQKADEEDEVEAELVERKEGRPRCAKCNSFAKYNPAGDGKFYCGNHYPEES